MEREEFIKRLTELRVSKGVSAREMSLSVGMSENYINRMENGASLPTMSNFFYICEYLGITPKEFFDTDSGVNIKNRELYDLIMKLPEKQVASVTEMIKSML